MRPCFSFAVLSLAASTILATAAPLKLPPQAARLSAQKAGMQYAWGSHCGASPRLLEAYKISTHNAFRNAGSEFDTLFASGAARGDEVWNLNVHRLGKAPTYGAVCKSGNVVGHMQDWLSKHP